MSQFRVLFSLFLTCLLVAGCGSRSLGNKIDDQFLEPDVRSALDNGNQDLTSPTSHVVVVAYNGVILLAGQTPREELKSSAGQIAQGVRGVSRVHNELQIASPSSALARSNDAVLTTRIKTQMFADSNVPGSRIKVVTENGIVYLLGLVNHSEANAATALVQSVSGVQRIVRLFQYTD